jgi:hypothetical protein
MLKKIFAGRAGVFPLVCLACLAALCMPDASAQGAGSAWLSLAPGIDYREFFLPEPQHVYVARLDRSNTQVGIETSLAKGSLTGGLETVSEQAALYDQSLNETADALGSRYHVIAAINGGFFDPDTGFLTGGLIHSGWYASRFEDRQTTGGFAWGTERQPFITECIVQPPGKQKVVLLDSGESIAFDGVNLPRGDDQLILYTPQFGSQTPEAKQGLEIVVELAQPPALRIGAEMVSGTVSQVRQDRGGAPLYFDQVVLSADGKPARAMQGRFKPGDKIGLDFEIRLLDGDCRKARSETLDGARAALGGGAIFLRQGQIQPLSDLGSVLRNPRTAVAMNDRYVFFIVVDGRDQLRSLGMSMVELGLFAKLQLGAVWGVAMDGGGSSTMVVNGEVKNNPNAETVVRAKPDKLPRAVADGLMMVMLEPAERSGRFQPGERVSISDQGDANLRLGPGLNYASLATLPPGSQGAVLAHPLDGILAKGYYWWKIDFGDRVGWVSESVLQAGG